MSNLWHGIVQSVKGYYVGKKQTAVLHVVRFLPFLLFVTAISAFGFSVTLLGFAIAAILFVALDFIVFDRLSNKLLARLGYKKRYQDDPQNDSEQEFIKEYKQLPSADDYKKMQDKLQKRFRDNP